MKPILQRARELADDHERYEQGGGASELLRELAAALEAADSDRVDALALLTEVRADGIMEDWAGDLPARLDATIARLSEAKT